MKNYLARYIAAAVALIIIWFIAAFQPHLKEYNETTVQIDEAKQKLNDFQKTILLLPEIVRTRDALAKRKDEINSSLYTKENILALFASFNDLANKHRVRIVEITPPIEELLKINRVSPDSSQLMFLNIGLRVEGDYRDFGKFVTSLETEEFYRGPNHCNIVGTRDRQFPVQYHFGFKSLLGSLKDEA